MLYFFLKNNKNKAKKSVPCNKGHFFNLFFEYLLIQVLESRIWN